MPNRGIFGIFRRTPPPPHIVTIASLYDGSARVGDLVDMVGGCPRVPGDHCDLVGGYSTVVMDYKGELYYQIVP